SAPARRRALPARQPDNCRFDSLAAPERLVARTRPARAPASPRMQGSSSRRFGHRLRSDGLVVLVEQRYAIVEQDPVDGRLVLLDQAVELALPVLIGGTHAHANAIHKPRA